MKSIAVICKHNMTSFETAKEAIDFLTSQNCKVLLSEDFSSEDFSAEKFGSEKFSSDNSHIQYGDETEIVREADLILVLGGDGTIIHTAYLLNGAKTPILGINLGTLGFLTEIPVDSLKEVLGRAITGDFKTTERRMLHAKLIRDGGILIDRIVLNDAVINKGALARILGLKAYTEQGFMTTYRGDGLIISTPTGSTAYNMSAGGPVLFPTLNACILTPICPHTFANRPVVLSGNEEISVELIEANGDVYLTLDGQYNIEMKKHDKLVAKLSDRFVNLVSSPDLDFFHILRHKLGWGQK